MSNKNDALELLEELWNSKASSLSVMKVMKDDWFLQLKYKISDRHIAGFESFMETGMEWINNRIAKTEAEMEKINKVLQDNNHVSSDDS